MARQSLLGTEIKRSSPFHSHLYLSLKSFLTTEPTTMHRPSTYITPQPFAPSSDKQAFRNIVSGQILTVLVGLGLLIEEALS